jgi:hypothetical protein
VMHFGGRGSAIRREIVEMSDWLHDGVLEFD